MRRLNLIQVYHSHILATTDRAESAQSIWLSNLGLSLSPWRQEFFKCKGSL